ncbi:MAG TPA: hypothetical protein VM165_19770, partial [Planctomycetaceae bacterium]|nr:hypothetical protein [Planctomycetaceae bacterium]
MTATIQSTSDNEPRGMTFRASHCYEPQKSQVGREIGRKEAQKTQKMKRVLPHKSHKEDACLSRC